jgi:hypothetical protein
MPRSFIFRAAVLAVSCAVGATSAAYAAEPAIVVKRETDAGKEVLVRGFAEFDASCSLVRVQTVTVVVPPHGGRVESRPGPVVIGPNWVGGGNCVGTTLQGVNVFYVPAPGFSGSDAFSLDVGYSKRRIVRAEVAVTVR